MADEVLTVITQAQQRRGACRGRVQVRTDRGDVLNLVSTPNCGKQLAPIGSLARSPNILGTVNVQPFPSIFPRYPPTPVGRFNYFM